MFERRGMSPVEMHGCDPAYLQSSRSPTWFLSLPVKPATARSLAIPYQLKVHQFQTSQWQSSNRRRTVSQMILLPGASICLTYWKPLRLGKVIYFSLTMASMEHPGSYRTPHCSMKPRYVILICSHIPNCIAIFETRAASVDIIYRDSAKSYAALGLCTRARSP